MKSLKSVFTAGALALLPLAYGGTFSVDTQVSSAGSLFTYEFMLRSASNSGEGSLTTPIWQWSFESEPGLLQPTAVSTPTGWSYNYDPESGIFQWYTEGPNGWSTGDFGSNTIPLGESLSGFRLTSPLAPDLSIAEAIDTDFNSDFSLATVPVQAVPEPTTITAVALGAGILLRRRRRGRHERRPYQEEG